MNLTKIFFSTSLFMSMFFYQSCVRVDKKYDLNNILKKDQEISLGGEHFAIPIASSNRIYMKDLLKPDESNSNDIVIKDHIYHFISSFETPSQNLNISNEATFDNIELVNTATITTVGIGGTAMDISDISGFTINSQKNVEFTIPDQITKEIGHIEMNELPIYFSIDLKNCNYSEIHFPELRLTFPKYLVLNVNGMPNNPTLSQTQDGLPEVVYSDLRLTKGQKLKVGVRQIRFADKWNTETNKPTDDANGLVIRNRKGSLNLSFKISADRISAKQFSTQAGQNPQVKSSIYLSGPITFTSSSRKIETQLNITKDIALSNIPENWKNGSTILPYNSTILLKINNNFIEDSQMDVNTNIYTSKGSDQGSPIQINGLKLIPGENILKITKQPTEQKFTSQSVVDNLTDLFTNIPDKISININTNILPTKYITTRIENAKIPSIQGSIDIPFTFENGTHIMYKDSVDIGSLSTDDKLYLNEADLVMDFETTIPFSLKVDNDKIKLKDANGNVLPFSRLSITKNTIQGSNDNNPVKSRIIIHLESNKEDYIFSKLKKICFEANCFIDSQTPQSLRDDQWIKANKIYLKIPNGIVYHSK